MFRVGWIAVSPKLCLMCHEKPNKCVNIFGAMLLFPGTMLRSKQVTSPKCSFGSKTPGSMCRVLWGTVIRSLKIASFLHSWRLLRVRCTQTWNLRAWDRHLFKWSFRHHNTRTHTTVQHISIHLTVLQCNFINHCKNAKGLVDFGDLEARCKSFKNHRKS